MTQHESFSSAVCPPAVFPLDWKNFVLLLTHRRGGIVLGLNREKLKLSEMSASDDKLAAEIFTRLIPSGTTTDWQRHVTELCLGWRVEAQAGSDSVAMFAESGVAIALSRATTAEYLSDMYIRVLDQLDMQETQVENIILSIGPGSFTGLRIGCAFANGLSRGRPRFLYGVPCVGLHILRDIVSCANCYEDWKNAFSVIESGKDESFAPIGLLDAAAALAKVCNGEAAGAIELEPNYGKEPGPVIKLREQEKRE